MRAETRSRPSRELCRSHTVLKFGVKKMKAARQDSHALGVLAASLLFLSPCPGRDREVATARITVSTGEESCQVELDGAAAGKTDAKGILALDDVDPTDHYLHIRCGNQRELAYFVSPRSGEKVEIHRAGDAPAAGGIAMDPLEAAEAKIKLRRDVQRAAQLRAQSQLDEAVQLLHEAARMDPENSDLHRELGITFLLNKEWKRARVEMLEALRHDPSDADAHNGLGYALEKLGDIDGALKEYRAATHLEPDNANYRQHYLEGLGRLAIKQAEKKEKKN